MPVSTLKSALKTLERNNLELGPAKLAASAEPGPFQHWRLSRDAEGIAWLILDKKGASANTLSTDVLTELGGVVDALEKDPPRGLILRSGKKSGFVAGADIKEFSAMDPSGVNALLTSGHALLDRFEALRFPTVAVVHGFCLGGGLELALACKYRIATEDASFGFPEVMLGLHPGLGGTFRSLRLISPLEAMSIMLTGRTVRARAARSLGLVDAVVPERHVAAAARAAALGTLRTNRAKWLPKLLNAAPLRGLVATRMRKETRKKADPAQYPAPFALIDIWEKFGGDEKAMQREEIASFARLLLTPTARGLIRVFFLRDKLKGFAGSKWDGRRVHVIGAGAMGGDIASWCAWKGYSVTLADMKLEPLGNATKRAADLFRKLSRKSTDTRDALDRFMPDPTGDGVASADIVIEAVPEVLSLKQKVYASIEPRMKPGAILATNTSSIPLEQLREGLQRPERLVGLHFFNPVSRMQLVEIVSHDQAAPEVLAAARAFTGRIERLPAPVKSAPGFLVNRALVPYMIEAMVMVDEGIKKETVDAAAEKFGMPMGPIELADQVGLDICVNVADELRANLARPMPPSPKWLGEMVQRGELGRKTGKGFYVWKDGKVQKGSDAPAPTEEMTDRLILPMLDVCIACLREGVVEDEDVVDGAMIFATGFAPFRGGPMNYARQRGIADIRAKLERLAQLYGERFRPDPGWDRLGS